MKDVLPRGVFKREEAGDGRKGKTLERKQRGSRGEKGRAVSYS